MPVKKPRQLRHTGLSLSPDLSGECLLTFIRQLSDKKPKGALDGVSELSRQQLMNVSSSLHILVQDVLAATAAAKGDAEQMDEEAARYYQQMPEVKEAVLSLHGAALLAAHLLVDSQQDPPDTLQNVALLLHDGALLNDLEPIWQGPMQDAVQRLCYLWWERKAPRCDELVARSYPYMLFRTVHGTTKAHHIKEIYNMRGALEQMELDDPSAAQIKQLCLYSAMHPAYLQLPEGRRFIADLFRLTPDMTRELGAVLRNQIVSGHRSTLEHYSEILFRAWRDTMGPCAAVLETEVIEPLMQSAILASTPALATSLRSVLDGLNGQKNRNVEKTLSPALLRLYDPILPRAFGAANADVRCNALHLLVGLFPLIDPASEPDEITERCTQQLNMLLECLKDPCPAVRETAVSGCCSILYNYWEVIPAATSAKMISEMTGKLAYDASSRAVRVAVLRGMQLLVESENALPVLRKALPGLSSLLSDSDPKVREALADLLVAVSGCRNLPFWTIAPAEDLLQSMASDIVPAVALKIARILVPSYFPNTQEGPARLAALLSGQPEAGQAFCRQLVARFLPEASPRQPAFAYTASVPVEQILELMTAFVGHLTASIPAPPDEVVSEQRPQKRAKAAARCDKAGPGAAGGAKATAGKKRAKKKAASYGSDGEAAAEGTDEQYEQEAANGLAAGTTQAASAGGDSDEDMVLQDPTAETTESWISILSGLAVVVEGVAAAVAAGGECGAEDVAGALPDDSFQQLLRVAEERVQQPEAMKLVLEMAISLHFTPAAQHLRASLFERLRTGALPGMAEQSGDGESEAQESHRQNSVIDAELLSITLRALSVGTSSNKLVAMLAAALGVRQAPEPLGPASKSKKADVAKAGGVMLETLEHVDAIACECCGHAQPEETMLLCDGCDTACHTHCLLPALEEVPECDWFCWRCEEQLQSAEIIPETAAHCICLLLQFDEGRQLLCGHAAYGDMLEGLLHLADAEAHGIQLLVHGSAPDEADSAPAAGVGVTAGAGCTGDGPGDAWGSMSRFCRAALHRTMHILFCQDHSPDDTDGEQDGGEQPAPKQRTPAPRGRMGRRGRRSTQSALTPAAGVAAAEEANEQQRTGCGRPSTSTAGGLTEGEEQTGAAVHAAAFESLATALAHARMLCDALLEAVKDVNTLPARLAALQYCQGLLRALSVMHLMDGLTLDDQHVSWVAALCAGMAQLACTTAAAAASEDDGEEGEGEPDDGGPGSVPACLVATLQLIMVVGKQLAEAAQRGGSGTGSGLVGADNDDDDLPSQQLESRMEAAAASGDAPRSPGAAAEEEEQEPPTPSSRESVEALASDLVMLLSQPASGALLRAVQSAATDLFGELLAATRRASNRGWLAALCTNTGTVVQSDPRVTAKLEVVLHGPKAREAEAAPNQGTDDNEPDENVPAHGGAGVPAPRGGRRAASKAEPQPAAAGLLGLVQEASPAIGALAGVLVGAAGELKVYGRCMLQLASLAKRSLAEEQQETPDEHAPGPASSSALPLGAVVLLLCCNAAAAEARAPRQAPRKVPGGRGAALADLSAMQAEREDAEARERALAVLQSAANDSRALQPLVAGAQGGRQAIGFTLQHALAALKL